MTSKTDHDAESCWFLGPLKSDMRTGPDFTGQGIESQTTQAASDVIKGELKYKIIFSLKVLKNTTNSKMALKVFKCF